MTMPSPRRVARRSIVVLVGMGLTKPDAARTVQVICDEVIAIIWRRDPELDVTWLADIAAEAGAVRQQASPIPDCAQLAAAYDAAYPVVSGLIRQLDDLRPQQPPADTRGRGAIHGDDLPAYDPTAGRRPGA